jgi:hypothetical protein
MEGLNNAKQNALNVIAISGDMRDRQRVYTMNGVEPKAQVNYKLAGKGLYFHPKAATMDDLLHPSGSVPAPSGSEPRDQSWTWAWSEQSGNGQIFYYFPHAGNGWPNDPAASITASSGEVSESARVLRFVFNNAGDAMISVQADTPFKTVPVADRQQYLMSLNAITTGGGGDFPVTWTAVARDESRKLGRQAGGKHAGQPLAGAPADFCQQTLFGGTRGGRLTVVGDKVAFDGSVLQAQPRNTYVCGGMAFEFQLRSPVVFNQGEPVSAGEQPSVGLPQSDGQTGGEKQTLTPRISSHYF